MTARLKQISQAVVTVILMGGPAVGEVAMASPPTAPASSKAAGSLGDALTGTARADYATGRLLASDGDFEGARLRFQSAYDVSKDPRLLWNVAFCEKNLRHYSRVIALVDRYLSEGATILSARDKKEAQELTAMLAPLTAKVRFDVSEEGAEVFVDDRSIGISPIEDSVLVDVGVHRIRATKPGFVTNEATTAVGGAPEASLVIRLDREVHSGTLVVHAPEGAAISIDGADVAQTSLDQTLSSGGHQLRVSAKGMRSYQSEVVIRDLETRSVDVVLERIPETAQPPLRVAVGCGDSDVMDPERGLRVYLDGSQDALVSSGVNRQWDEREKRTIVRFATFLVPTGVHHATVSGPRCRSLGLDVNVSEAKGGDIVGALPTTDSFVTRGPAGNPDGWQLSLGTWIPWATNRYGGANVASYGVEYRQAPSPGIQLSAGYVGRWFVLALDSEVAPSAWYISHDPCAGVGQLGCPGVERTEVHDAWLREELRIGARIPINEAAFEAGAGLGPFGLTNLDQLHFAAGFWASVLAQPFCDWAAYGTFALEAQIEGLFGNELVRFGAGNVFASLAFGVRLEPNGQCHKEHDGSPHLTSRAR